MDRADQDDPLAGATAALYDYAEAVDEARVDDFVALFTDDAVFFDDAVCGPDAIGKRCSELLARFSATSHHLSNIRLVSVSGFEAEVRAYVYAWHRLIDGDTVEIWGRYNSRIRFDGGRWRFANHMFQTAGVRPEGVLGTGVAVPRRSLDQNNTGIA
jgi:ketosteroid isomerase-like protein